MILFSVILDIRRLNLKKLGLIDFSDKIFLFYNIFFSKKTLLYSNDLKSSTKYEKKINKNKKIIQIK